MKTPVLSALLARLVTKMIGPKRAMALTLGAELVRSALAGSDEDIEALVRLITGEP